MRRAACGPLAGPRVRTASIGEMDRLSAPAPWEALGGMGRAPAEAGDTGRELRRRLLAYGLRHCLTPAQREAVELCWGQGLTVTGAAALLGLSPSAVSRRLTAAMGRLRALAGEG